MDSDGKSVLRWRLAKAAAIVLAVVCVVPGIDAVMRVTHVPGQAQASAIEWSAYALEATEDPFEALDRVDDAISAGESEVPDRFREEVGFLAGAEDIRCNDDGSVVGYAMEGNEGQVFDELVRHMEALGWTGVSLNGVNGATFLKDGGRCTWALATCTQVGGSVAVVVRCLVS